MTDTTEALPPHPSHATVRDWMPVAEALRLADLWTVGDLDNSGQWRAAIKVLADEVRAAIAQRGQVPEGWSDADADAARLALELECMLTDKDVPTSTVSRWWDSAHEALDLHRKRVAALTAAPSAQAEIPDLRCAKWLDPECADAGACQSLKFKAAPSAQPAIEPLLFRDLALELGVSVATLTQTIARRGLGNFSVNMAVPVTVAKAARDPAFGLVRDAAPSAQAEPQVPLDIAAIRAACRAEALEEAAQRVDRLRARESAATADHAGNWHEAYEHHLKRHAAMSEVLDAIREMK